jgi:pilus assembly protein Flp/PilA
MNATLTIGRRLLADESGATAIEYALLAALIAGVLIGTIATLGTGVMTRLFKTTSSELSSAIEEAS